MTKTQQRWINSCLLNFCFPLKRLVLVLLTLVAGSADLFAWSNGSLLIWMDNDHAHALEPLAKKFEDWLGIQVRIETPENITNTFPLAAQAGKGPDIVIWAHDKLGEWADAGLIGHVEISDGFGKKFFLKAWLYNKRLLEGYPPATLADLVPLNHEIKAKRSGVTTILWDYKSAYYSWGILASAGAYVFANTGSDYDLNNVGVATPGAVKALSTIAALVRSGVLPKSVSYSDTEQLMAQGKLAMMISGPWAWSNLMKSGIDFGLAPIPGAAESPGRPFVGVSVAYLNRSSPNRDLAEEFLENVALTDEGLSAMDHAKPLGVPALISLYDKMAGNNPLLRQLKVAVDHGQIMPNIPQMSRFFASLGLALQTATEGRASPEAALREADTAMRKK